MLLILSVLHEDDEGVVPGWVECSNVAIDHQAVAFVAVDRVVIQLTCPLTRVPPLSSRVSDSGPGQEARYVTIGRAFAEENGV